mmetsp:Transcript_27709/g.69883  ORF Transcript_27709/g.69883 Transcript_27709/m.69883 type:complete len:210 (+) Transcript_27709:96-725(+)
MPLRLRRGEGRLALPPRKRHQRLPAREDHGAILVLLRLAEAVEKNLLLRDSSTAPARPPSALGRLCLHLIRVFAPSRLEEAQGGLRTPAGPRPNPKLSRQCQKLLMRQIKLRKILCSWLRRRRSLEARVRGTTNRGRSARNAGTGGPPGARRMSRPRRSRRRKAAFCYSGLRCRLRRALTPLVVLPLVPLTRRFASTRAVRPRSELRPH